MFFSFTVYIDPKCTVWFDEIQLKKTKYHVPGPSLTVCWGWLCPICACGL